MARCKLTTMTLRNTRKTREYQALLIDFVSAGVIDKSAAEELLGYTIPPGLLDGDTPGPDPEPEAETPVITTDLDSSASLTSEITSIDLTIVASVTDGGTLSYAWTKDGDALVGATTATLTVNEAGTYQCTVTNTLGEDTATAQSTACVVTAAAAEAETPVITTDLPASKNVPGDYDSDELTIVASVTDGGTLSYAWTKDGEPDGGNGPTLYITSGGTYQCTVTNTLGEDTATAQSTACVVTWGE